VPLVLGDLDRHPILGGGTASYREQHPTAGQSEQDIANLELAVLNDIGILGLVAFAAFAVEVAGARGGTGATRQWPV
jgi:hypothetical protein